MQFGKNRVQYQPFIWNYFDFTSYKVYFYMGGDKTARYVGDKAKEFIGQLFGFMDYQLQGTIDFILFNKESEYAQSNIGLSTDEQYNTGGVNKIVGHKVILYFDGNHEKLNEQMRLGITQVMFNEMMYGGSLTNVVRSSALLNIPPWFEQGFEYYAANGWTPEIDNHVRDGIESGRYKKFNHLTGMDATYAGISIWNYIAQTYGETVIPNVLYLARTTRSIESAFLFVLGTNLKGLTTDWLNYYEAQFKKDNTDMIIPKTAPLVKKPKNSRVYYQLHASPDGRYIVYSTNELGKMKVWLYDLQTHKRKKILKQGAKINRILDYSYPLMAWHPTSQLFSVILEEKGKLMLYTYTLSDHKLEGRRIVNFQKILDFSYADDGTKFVMSAVQDGQTDIFVFTAASNGFEQITKDVYDDLTPRFIDHSNKIIFSSNRPDDTLRLDGDYHKMQNHFDIFEYDYAAHSLVLRRITNTPGADETNPMGFGGKYVSYLSNASGIVNRYIASVDSTISFVDTAAHYRYVVHSFPVTDFARNIIEQDITNNNTNYTQIFYYKGKYWMYDDTLSAEPGAFEPASPANTSYIAGIIAAQKKKMRNDSIAANAKKDTSAALVIKLPPVTFTKNPVLSVSADTTQKKQADTAKINPAHIPVNINDYSFDNTPPPILKIPVSITPPATITSQPQVVQKLQALKDTARHDTSHGRKHVLERQDYHISFSPDFVTLQLNNSYLNAMYQPYIPVGPPSYQQPEISGLLQARLSDLFEDYHIEGDARISLDLSTNEYMFTYSDLSKRLDKEIILYRGAILDEAPTGYYPIDIYTHEATYLLKWPFSEVARVEGSASVIQSKAVTLASDVPSAEYPNQYDYMPKGEFAYVYDATIPVELNINYGLRAKIFAQYFRDMGGPNNPVPNYNMYILGFDARYYMKLSRDLIWANRISGGTSFGQEKLLYYMGGEDGWISPQFDQNTNVSQTENYGYQTLALPLRGFDENIRNGNNFVLYNSEVRWPIFHYLINRPIKSDFFNNFQVIGFFDVGTAWTGLTPYSSENNLNQTVYSKYPVTVILSTLQDPFVEGFGYGLRTRIFGYFVRFDEAWGINNGVISKTPILYFSLSLDF